MLTNLNWIKEGMPFPPEQEKGRLKKYRENELLFEGEHLEVFGSNFAEIERFLRKRHINPSVVFGYPQLLTKKTADFVCGEPVGVDIGGGGEALSALLRKTGFDTMLYEAVMDLSRFGDAPIKILKNRISLVSPDCWFPIVEETDIKHITAHVIAFFIAEGEGGGRIYVEIHNAGRVEIREYLAKKDEGKLVFGALKKSEEILTGLDDFAIKIIKNVSHSKSIYGVDDYGIIKSLVQKIMWRLHCIDSVLDKHSEPSISGPGRALSYDDRTGMYFLNLGNYFKRDRADDPTIEYLTWDGNLDSSFREIEFLMKQLYILSEMGASFMDADGGVAESGTALKLKMTSPRVKAQRIAGINTETVKQIISHLARVNGIEVEAGAILLTWHDGMPNDRREDANILATATGGKAFMSQLSAVKSWGGGDEAIAIEEARKMFDENAFSN